MRRPLVLHLNGVPGVGKSTLARRWADEHPGTLLVEPDELCTWVSGWRDDFGAVLSRIRPVALAMITAAVADGLDVVLPQLLADPREQARFVAAGAGSTYVEVVLTAPDAAARFAARPADTEVLRVVRRFVEEAGPGHLEGFERRLTTALADRPGAVVLPTVTGDLDATYAALEIAVRDATAPRSP